MLMQFITVGVLMLLSVMLPGPDFALVTRNSIVHSRRAGIWTAFGIAGAVTVHISYCILGLALVISKSLLIFSLIKYIGAAYLFYLGTMMLLKKAKAGDDTMHIQTGEQPHLSNLTAFRQGFICNLFNPKATLFFLALFTVIIKPGTPKLIEISLATEMLVIIIAWFSTLALILSHPRTLRILNRVEKYIEKVVGVFLIGFGVALTLLKQSA